MILATLYVAFPKSMLPGDARAHVARILGDYPLGWTITDGLGFWQGSQEQSLVLQSVGPAENRRYLTEIAGKLKTALHQRYVLLTVSELDRAEFL